MGSSYFCWSVLFLFEMFNIIKKQKKTFFFTEIVYVPHSVREKRNRKILIMLAPNPPFFGHCTHWPVAFVYIFVGKND